MESGTSEASSADPAIEAVESTAEALAIGSRCTAPSLALGDSFSCLVRPGGAVACWGGNTSRQLGVPTPARTVTPADVPGISGAIAVAAGSAHACALLGDGTVTCWGANGSGQLGTGATGRYAAPASVSGLAGVTSLAAGALHTCALRNDGTVWCWGSNGSGRLGDGTTTRRTRPVQVRNLTSAVALTAGAQHTCALTRAGEAYCWGSNSWGQLGDASRSTRTRPVLVSGAHTWRSISAGQAHTCGVLQSAGNGVECWGRNSTGQLGDGTLASYRTSPVSVTEGDGTPLTDGVMVAASGSTTCLVRGSGGAACWGANNQGQGGDGTLVSPHRSAVNVVAEPPLAGAFLLVARGTYHTCALAVSGEPYCWGYNYHGQLGDGSRSRHLTPARSGSTAGLTFASFGVEDDVSAERGSEASSVLAFGDTLLVAGLAHEAASDAWVLRRSRDRGANWSTPASLSFDGTASAPHLARLESGTLFLGGAAAAEGGTAWVMRRSSDGGDTWEALAPYLFDRDRPASFEALAVDAAGRLYAAGSADDASGRHWLVRATADSGSTWFIADDYAPPGGAIARAVLDAGAAGLFVAGEVTSGGQTHLHVRRAPSITATDRATTWLDADDFQLEAGFDTVGTSLAADLGGRVYALAQANGADGWRWVLRATRDGSTWSTVSTFQVAPGTPTRGAKLFVDRAGALHVVGTAERFGSVHGVLASSYDHGATWVLSDELGSASLLFDVAEDGIGALHAAGVVGTRWSVRSRTCLALSPSCGNWVLDPGELCDGDCSDCNDHDACTTDVMVGSPTSCNVVCSNTPITACVSGDGCCGAGCTSDQDLDCCTGPIENGACIDVSFKIEDLATGECQAAEHSQITGAGRGGLAVSSDSVFYTGAGPANRGLTGRFSASNLVEGRATTAAFENLFSDLRTGAVYTLGTGAVALRGAGTVTTLLPLDLATGQATTPRITLSRSIVIASGRALFSGYGRLVLYSGARVYDVQLPSGQVTDLGSMTLPSHNTCPNLGAWGVAESFNTGLYVTYASGAAILRTRVPDGSTETLRQFTDLGGTCAIGYSMATKRWYFEHAGTSEVATGTQTLVSCDAHIRRPQAPPLCGDGVLEAGETCDGDCPTSCDDGDACTADVATGAASACNLTCTHAPVTSCASGDGCCPAGCSAATDGDCTAACGNGVVEPGETCDGNCPASCDDGNACTTDVATGLAMSCNMACTHAPVTTCQSGDGCCPAGCTANDDHDCSATCGNGVVEAGETCDGNCPTSCSDGDACTTDVATGSAGSCSAGCTHAPVTSCASGDGCCPAGCTANDDDDCLPICGNGVVEAGETCDGSCPTSCNDGDACTTDVATGSAGACSAACAHQPITACAGGDGCCPSGCAHATDADCPDVPGLSGVSPSQVTEGAGTTVLTLTGTSFIAGAVVSFDGAPVATARISSTELRVTLAAATLAAAGTHSLVVTTSGGTSGALTFTVNHATPGATALTPSTVTAGAGNFTLTVTGGSFLSGATVGFAGATLSTTFVSATELTATVPAALVASAGSYGVTVANPAPTVGASAALTFTVSYPTPAVSSLTPASVTAASGGFTLTLGGGPFSSGAVVAFGAATLPTTFVSSTQLTAPVPASAVTTAGSYGVTVTNPSPTAGPSAPSTFTVNNPTPAISALTPSSVTAGAAGFTLTVAGTSFLSGAVVTFDGTGLATTFVSATELTAVVPAASVALGGTYGVTVTNPSPTAGASPAATFTVNNATPAISALTPSSAPAGSATFTLTVDGAGFLNGAVVALGGTGLATTFVSATRLTAWVTSGTLTTAGTANVTVTNPAPTAGASSALTFTVNNPSPSLVSATPASVTAGAGAFTLTLDGSSFVSGVVASFNGTALATTFVSSSRITASVPAASVAIGGTYSITAANPAPSGGPSAALSYTVYNPTPTVSTLTPSSVTAGAAGFTLTVAGTSFLSGAVVSFNGAALATTYVSSTSLRATVPAASVATGGTYGVTVSNPAPTAASSGAATFTVNNTTPTITTLTPASVTLGAGAFTLTVDGSGFVGGAAVTFGGTLLSTTVVSATRVTATVPLGSIAAAGTRSVTVANAAPSVGSSGALTFTVNNPTPSLTATTPSSLAAGAAAFTLTVTGTNFVSGAVVTFNGTALTTTYVSSGQVTAAVPAASVATAGLYNVTAANPTPRAGTSAALTFTVNAPGPTLTALSPSSAAVGSAQLTVTLTGTNFVSGSYATFNGTNLTTTYVSSTQLTATVPAASLASAGAYNVTVVNPAPGGGTSAAQTFNVTAVVSGLALHYDAANATSAPSGSSTWFDLSGNGRNGTLTNGAVFDTTRGGSVYLDGADDRVVVPNGFTNILRNATTWTFSVWLSVRQFSPCAYPVIFSAASPASYYEFFLEISASQTWTAAGGVLQSSVTSASAGNVYNFVWVLSGSNAYFYQNGALVGTYTGMVAHGNVSADLLIGAFMNSGYELAGNLYQVQIYNRALSGAEVTQGFNNLRSRFGL